MAPDSPATVAPARTNSQPPSRADAAHPASLEPHALLARVEDRVARWGRHLHLQAADVDDMRQAAAAAALRLAVPR
jgi:hypothetical protein